MKNTDYDSINKECRQCGCLIPNTDKDREAHTAGECLRMKFYSDERSKPVSKVEPLTMKVEKIEGEPGKFLIRLHGSDLSFLTTQLGLSFRLTKEQLEKLVTMGEQEIFDSSITKGE